MCFSPFIQIIPSTYILNASFPFIITTFPSKHLLNIFSFMFKYIISLSMFLTHLSQHFPNSRPLTISINRC